MSTNDNPTIAVDELRLGLFVLLDLGWMDHPFPRNSFKITSPKQIETLRSLGVKQVRYDPSRSDPPTDEAAPAKPEPLLAAVPVAPALTEAQLGRQKRQAALAAQRQALQRCERQYTEGARSFRSIHEDIEKNPEAARERSTALVGGMLNDMLDQGESAIRLLSDVQGDRASMHALNVTVLSLLLGKAMGLSRETLDALGLAALLHDIGKSILPEQVRYRDDGFTAAHHKLYQEHVMHGVNLGKKMGLSPLVLVAMSQHHEMDDGSGFPLGTPGEKMSQASRVLALINRYDDLCNPPNPLKALTPHEALSVMFATMKTRFDKTTLSAFIRMMGVYPPGSIVQLTDGRYAVVAAVNSARPLKPRVMVHDPAVASSEALLLDLQNESQVGIQRSLRADQLPRAALEYLEPRQRYCYFFERALRPEGEERAA